MYLSFDDNFFALLKDIQDVTLEGLILMDKSFHSIGYSKKNEPMTFKRLSGETQILNATDFIERNLVTLVIKRRKH